MRWRKRHRGKGGLMGYLNHERYLLRVKEVVEGLQMRTDGRVK